ncbi:MAG: hypothetical protein ACRENG_22365 [bacterium]
MMARWQQRKKPIQMIKLATIPTKGDFAFDRSIPIPRSILKQSYLLSHVAYSVIVILKTVFDVALLWSAR